MGNNVVRCRPDEGQWVTNPAASSGEATFFPEAFGQDGAPFMFLVRFPPNDVRVAHSHHDDIFYVFVAGENHVEGEGTYRAGDVRWVRAGHVYGPEKTGPDGASWWVISKGNPAIIPVADPATT
jgi:hypothetical protein